MREKIQMYGECMETRTYIQVTLCLQSVRFSSVTYTTIYGDQKSGKSVLEYKEASTLRSYIRKVKGKTSLYKAILQVGVEF